MKYNDNCGNYSSSDCANVHNQPLDKASFCLACKSHQSWLTPGNVFGVVVAAMVFAMAAMLFVRVFFITIRT